MRFLSTHTKPFILTKPFIDYVRLSSQRRALRSLRCTHPDPGMKRARNNHRSQMATSLAPSMSQSMVPQYIMDRSGDGLMFSADGLARVPPHFNFHRPQRNFWKEPQQCSTVIAAHGNKLAHELASLISARQFEPSEQDIRSSATCLIGLLHARSHGDTAQVALQALAALHHKGCRKTWQYSHTCSSTVLKLICETTGSIPLILSHLRNVKTEQPSAVGSADAAAELLSDLARSDSDDLQGALLDASSLGCLVEVLLSASKNSPLQRRCAGQSLSVLSEEYGLDFVAYDSALQHKGRDPLMRSLSAGALRMIDEVTKHELELTTACHIIEVIEALTDEEVQETEVAHRFLQQLASPACLHCLVKQLVFIGMQEDVGEITAEADEALFWFIQVVLVLTRVAKHGGEACTRALAERVGIEAQSFNLGLIKRPNQAATSSASATSSGHIKRPLRWNAFMVEHPDCRPLFEILRSVANTKLDDAVAVLQKKRPEEVNDTELSQLESAARSVLFLQLPTNRPVKKHDRLPTDRQWSCLHSAQERWCDVQTVKHRRLRAAAMGISIQMPDEFICPISMEQMLDPVVASDGHTYEREQITQILRTRDRTSPMTRDRLDAKVLVPNFALKKRMDSYEEEVLRAAEQAVTVASGRQPLRHPSATELFRQWVLGVTHQSACKNTHGDVETLALRTMILEQPLRCPSSRCLFGNVTLDITED